MDAASASTPRPRPQRSCYTCARRKVGCDRRRPKCTRCTRAGLPCGYGPPQRRVQFIHETPSAESSTSRSTPALAELALASPQQDPVFESQHGLPGYLHRGADSQSRYVSPTYFAVMDQENAELDKLLRAQQDAKHDERGDLFLDAATEDILQRGRSRRGPPSSNPLQENTLRTQLFHGDLFPRMHKQPTDENLGTARRTRSSAATAVFNLPSEEQCRVLIWGYMGGYHAISAVFHGPSFLTQYHEFRNWLNGANARYKYDGHFFALLSAVLYVGAVVCPKAQLHQAFGNVARETLHAQLYARAVIAMRLSGFPQTPSIASLSAFVIVGSTWLREEEPLACCSFVGVCVRIAQMLGLHKDASYFPDMHPLEIEIRRRLWWHIFNIDTQVAAASGLPPLISATSFDVKPLSEAPEEVLAQAPTTQGITPKSILGILSASKSRFWRNMSYSLCVLHSTFLTAEGIDVVLKSAVETRDELMTNLGLIQHADNAPASVDLSASEEDMMKHSESNPRLASLTQLLIVMMIKKPYAVMLGVARRHGLLGHLMEQEPRALFYCKQLLHIFLSLVENPDFQPWHWSWPGVHQPLHAIVAILLDLEEHPDSPSASATRQLIDLAFARSDRFGNGGIQSADDGELSQRGLRAGGRQAWELVRRLRERTWRKAGLDPDYLQCPERAADISVEDDAVPGAAPTVAESTPSIAQSQNFGHDALWGAVPETLQDWDFYGNLTDPFLQGLDETDQFNF